MGQGSFAQAKFHATLAAAPPLVIALASRQVQSLVPGFRRSSAIGKNATAARNVVILLTRRRNIAQAAFNASLAAAPPLVIALASRQVQSRALTFRRSSAIGKNAT